MALQFASFASSSSGNCYLVKSDTTAILIDVGIAGKYILDGLENLDIAPEEIRGILLTHEHIDHVRSLRMMSKKAEDAVVCGTRGTLDAVSDKVDPSKCRAVRPGEAFVVGDIQVEPFTLSHDAAEPAGYSLRHGGRQLTIVTDTGRISEEIFCQAAGADLLVLEANHEVNILQMGSYPYALKRRILGDEGHLSNEAAGACLCRLLQQRKARGAEGVPTVILAHLSKENNTPAQAYLTIRNMLMEEDFYIDQDLLMDIAARDVASPLREV